MKLRFFGLILIMITFKCTVIAQTSKICVLNRSVAPDSSLNDFLEIIYDKSVDNQVDAIRMMSTFEPYSHKQKLKKKAVYWARLNLKSAFPEKEEVIIQIGQKRSSDFAEMFQYDQNDSLLKHSFAGHFTKKADKDVKEEVGSKFLIHLEPGQTYTFYFRINNVSGFLPEFNVSTYSRPYFEIKINRRNLIQGMLQGALWILFLYNLLIFVYSRDKVYLYYSLYIIGMAFNFVVERGLFTEYTAPSFPKLEPYAFVLATGLATIAYFQFVRFFLNTKKHMPAWDRAHLWVVWINLVTTIVLLVILLISFNIPLSINVSNYLNLIGLLYGFVFIYYLIKQESKLAGFFIAGALFLAVGTFISLYFLITKKALDFDPKYFMNAGAIIEILIFSLGLGYRIRLIEVSKQKVQIELIEQLKQNDKLKEKVNRELEGKVKERTAEIELQKEEILAQSENLKTANDILITQKREIEQKNEEITQQKHYLEKIHQSTTDSINYASRIQNVILPSENELKKYFSEHYIFYKPKEIVSGDFYWYRYIERNNKRYFALAAADATGHGVPGSLVSMLGISLLNETVIRNEINSSSQVLEILREEVKATFSHSDERLLTRDGIDMAFCMIDLDSLEMQFSGANRPLLLFKKNGTVATEEEFKGLLEFKATKNPIGIYHKEQSFANNSIQLERGDVIYLFSDGYVDQVGGPDGRKFYLRRFKELLSEIYTKPLIEQKQIIVETHDNWIAHKFRDNETFRQVDDMLVMGIRI